MQRKRPRQPAPSSASGRVAESPDVAATGIVVRRAGVRYDAGELFPDSPRLSERQWQALELSANAKTNEVIASVMGNSERTVEDHLAKVREKLEASDRIEAIVFYHQAIEAKQEEQITQLVAHVRALEQQNAALRRQLRGR